MRQNPHVRICGGPGSATTLVYPTVSGRDDVYPGEHLAGTWMAFTDKPLHAWSSHGADEPFRVERIIPLAHVKEANEA